MPEAHDGHTPVRVIAVTSGKGGVGKTNVSVNLSLAMAREGSRVLLMDADLGLGNVDVLLGLKPTYNLAHLLSGERDLDEIIVEGPAGLRIVPAASGDKHMTELSAAEHAGLINAFAGLQGDIDALVIDTGAGIAENVLVFSRAAQEVIVVVCDEPASVTDAYALLKVLSTAHGVTRMQVVANMVNDAAHGRRLFDKLLRVTDRFLEINLHYLGALPMDEYLRRAVRARQAVLEAYPLSKSAVAMAAMARQVRRWPPPRHANGQLQFFMERLLGTAPAR